MELYYRRVESVRKGRTVPARTQTVVIFLPDVRSCLPTRFEWDELSIKYKKHLEMKKQVGDGEETVDNDKKHTKSDELTNDGGNAEAEIVVETSKSEKATDDGVIEGSDKHVGPAEDKAAENESSSAPATAASSKALLNIISNIT